MTTHAAELIRRYTRAVLAAQAAMLKHGDVANAPFGQSSARWRVLLHISLGQTTVAAIARSTGYSRQAVQRLADALVAEGLARYSPDVADRRMQRVALTREGQGALQDLEANFDVWAGRLLTQVAAADLEALSDALERITAVVQADIAYMQGKKEY